MFTATKDGFSALKVWRAVAATAVICLLAGAGYNYLAGQILRRRHPVPGNFYVVEGIPMHIHCVGSGSPPVILESGLGDDWMVWQKVQPDLSKVTRVCSYDRSGLGWSGARGGSRNALKIAEQLRDLLRTASIFGPFVVAGHSAGGLYARAFATRYPSDVAALVLVDASNPDAFRDSLKIERSRVRSARHDQAPWLWFRTAFGFRRLANDCAGKRYRGLDALADQAKAAACRPEFVNSWLGEWDEFESSAEELDALKCCGSVPLLILSQDPRKGDFDPLWHAAQERLEQLSSRSRRIVAQDSGHYVMIDRPDLVIEQISKLLHDLRAGVLSSDDEPTSER